MFNVSKIIIIIYIWSYLSILFHELGHYICAKIVKFQPYSVKVGKGHKILVRKIFNTRFELRLSPSGGLTSVSLNNLKWLKPRLLLYYSGGLIVNASLCYLFVSLFFIYQESAFIFVAIIEFLMFCNAVIPNTVIINNIQTYTDGKQILITLFSDVSQMFVSVIEAYQKNLLRYDNSSENSKKFFLNNDLQALQNLIYAETERMEKNIELSIELFLDILKLPDLSNGEKAFILDHLASIVVIDGYTQYLEKANIWSQKALNLVPNCPTIKGTRGAVLIELKYYEEGKEILLPLTTEDNEKNDIAICSCYLAKADYFLGNIDQSEKWLIKAEENEIYPLLFAKIKQEINHDSFPKND